MLILIFIHSIYAGSKSTKELALDSLNYFLLKMLLKTRRLEDSKVSKVIFIVLPYN